MINPRHAFGHTLDDGLLSVGHNGFKLLDPIDPVELAKQCASLPDETGWIEWKASFGDPERIGKYISGMSNVARLLNHPQAYLVWGVDDTTREIIGTSFNPRRAKKGNQGLIPWLRNQIRPDLAFEFLEGEVDNKKVVVLQIPAASGAPTKFNGHRYIRIDSHLKSLDDYVEEEAKLWERLRVVEYEVQPALVGLTSDQALTLLSHQTFFRLSGKPSPATPIGVLEGLIEQKLVRRNDDGRWTITNLGAILFANDLRDFSSLESKVVRLVLFRGNHKGAPRSEVSLPPQGYVVLFENLLTILNGLLPVNEVLTQTFRKDIRMFPEISLRELIPNALVHQDFTAKGAGPMIELFDNRLVVRNPGRPLLPPDRFLDQDRARNGRMVDLMRLLRICEKSGSGIDKSVDAIEAAGLPALEISVSSTDQEATETSVTLFAAKHYREMTVAEKVAAAYWHAAFRYVQGDRMSNESLRKRFNLDKSAYSQVSGVIKTAVTEGRIKPADPTVGNKAMRYVPWWVN